MMTKNYHHPQKNSYHDVSSVHKSQTSSESGDVYDHLYNVSKPIHITVYRNGDPFDAGIPVGVTRTQFKNWLNFLDYLTERLQLPDGAIHNVYTVHGEEVRHFKQLKHDGVYVGAKGEFKEADYGGKDTRRTKWQIRHASAKPDPTTVMSKESREIYLEQKGFRPLLDDTWDVANFDQKRGSNPGAHHSLKSNHETNKNHVGTKNLHSHTTHVNGKPVNKHLGAQSPKRDPYHAQKHIETKHSTKAVPVNKTHLKDNAYRIPEKGKAAPTKSRFPPIHTGSLVEIKKAKNDKDPKNHHSMKSRSNSAPETLHNKQLQAKKHEIARSSKSNFSEPKNFNSAQKHATTTKNHHAMSTGKTNDLKPPDGKPRIHDKNKKSPTGSVSPSLKSVPNQTKKNASNKSTHVPTQNTNHLTPNSKSHIPQSRSRSQGRAASSQYQSSQKRNKSLENAESFYSKAPQSRRASNYEEDYYDKDRSYKNEEEEEEYYEDERRRDSREAEGLYEDYDKKANNEYEYEREREHEHEYSASRSRRNSYKQDDYKTDQPSTRLHTSSYREPEYPEKDEYGDYNEHRDQYHDEPDYYENDKNDYEPDYERKATPKPAAKSNNNKRSKLPVSTSSKKFVEDKNAPNWANELTLAVRELASEVHNLGDHKN